MRYLVLLASSCLKLAAIPASTTLTLVNDPIPGSDNKHYGVLDITISGADITTSTTSTTLSGSVEAAFDVKDGKTTEMTLSDGVVVGSDFSASGTAAYLIFSGPYNLNATGLGGDFDTPSPPGTVTAETGEFDASQYRFQISQGSVAGAALGQSIESSYSPNESFEGRGSGTGTVTLTPAGSTDIYESFEVAVIIPGITAKEAIAVGTTFTTTVTVEATGSIKATGLLQVPRSEYLAWTINQGIAGAGGQEDSNGDGVPNAIAWALGLDRFEDGRSHLLRTANGGYEMQLPPSGTVAPITVQGSYDLSSTWSAIAPARLSGSLNPIPVGSTGPITISREIGEFLRLKVEE